MTADVGRLMRLTDVSLVVDGYKLVAPVHSCWMGTRPVRVSIELQTLTTPLTNSHDKVAHSAKVIRPIFDWTQRCGGPVY